MYYPINRATPPEGYVDKFDAADMLGLHPEQLLSGIRNGSIKITQIKVPGQKARNRSFYPRAEVEAEAARRAGKGAKP